MKKYWASRFPCVAVLLLSTTVAAAQQNAEEDDLALSYGDKSFVSIATGSPQAISRAPAVASVITAHDIESMGATDLDQVLESVPGLHVSKSSALLNPIYSFRGIFTGYNPQVLMLINGIPITNVFLGNRSIIWGGMPLENVARVEVIRGPGSALYGADAFSGVINVITKTAADIQGAEYGVRAGSFNSRDAWIQHGGELGPLEAAFYLRVGHTDGQKGIIQEDSQSFLDKNVFLSSPPASLAPGAINAVRNALDARADLSYDRWRFRAGVQQREVGMGAGLADNLDPNGRVSESRLYLDLTYQNTNWAPNWDLSSVLGYYDIKEKPAEPTFTLFPAGAFGGTFPNGMIGNPGHSERHTHGSISTVYSGLAQHRLRLGTGFRIEDLYDTSETKNFKLSAGGIPEPLGRIVDVSGTPEVYLAPHKRDLAYLFVQDEWSLAKDWTLTAGVRHDRYSDFGTTTNPRLALVWDAAYNVVIKVLHGRAFRAPSFTEQYSINNPVTIGNPDLKPETIATNELAFSWQPVDTLQTSLNLFHYRMRDIIRFVPDANGATAQNAGDQTGRGLELEATWDATRKLRLSGSFSLQHSTDEASGQDAGLAPHRRLFVRADWRFAPLWQLGTTINHVADRKRQPGDARPQIADYTTLDLSLRRERLAGDWTVSAMLLNLFNQDAREPSLAPGNIPFDLPLPGRALYVQFQHRF
ncbi:MAG: TonB-dependent receptor [Oxalobacteraceae bacterium]|nr:TonB-dependent receptor [Oxalobacteraceae bacterium]